MGQGSDRDAARRKVLRAYNRIAPTYDRVMALLERWRFRRWRERLWALAPPGRGLEVGVGTGSNIPYYPRGARVTAVDISPRMLEQARRRAQALGSGVDLLAMDAERLAFPDAAFDWAAATLVFCTVPDPVAGLAELRRVVKPGGRILLMEHVRIDKPVLGRLMDLLNPLVARTGGENINRRTVQTVRAAGLTLLKVVDLAPLGLVKLIVAGR